MVDSVHTRYMLQDSVLLHLNATPPSRFGQV